VKKQLKENKAPGENEQTGDEIEVIRRIGANTRVSGTIDDIELRVMLDAGEQGFYNEHPGSLSRSSLIVGF
jgi:hypothetical protein